PRAAPPPPTGPAGPRRPDRPLPLDPPRRRRRRGPLPRRRRGDVRAARRPAGGGPGLGVCRPEALARARRPAFAAVRELPRVLPRGQGPRPDPPRAPRRAGPGGRL